MWNRASLKMEWNYIHNNRKSNGYTYKCSFRQWVSSFIKLNCWSNLNEYNGYYNMWYRASLYLEWINIHNNRKSNGNTHKCSNRMWLTSYIKLNCRSNLNEYHWYYHLWYRASIHLERTYVYCNTKSNGYTYKCSNRMWFSSDIKLNCRSNNNKYHWYYHMWYWITLHLEWTYIHNNRKSNGNTYKCSYGMWLTCDIKLNCRPNADEYHWYYNMWYWASLYMEWINIHNHTT